MPEKTDASKLGIMVAGLVMSKNTYPTKDGKEKFSIDLAIPGQKQTVNCNVTAGEYANINLMEVFKGMMSFNIWKGNVYWQLAA